MARKLDDIFNECYERIRSGESLQSCLDRYPEYRAELEALLKTAFDIGRRVSYIHPRPEFKHWARARLEGAQQYARQQGQAEKPSHFSWWRQSWAIAATAALILLLTSGSTMAASSGAMPDEPLYPIKLATEEMRVALAVTDAQKAQVHTKLAEERAVEIEAMASEGKTEHAAITAARLAKQLELANSAIEKVESTAVATPTPTPEPTPTPTPTPEPAPVPPTLTDNKTTPTPTPKPEPEPAPVPPTLTDNKTTPTPTPEPTPAPTPEPEPAPVPPTLTDNKTTPPEDSTRDKDRAARWKRYKEALDKSTSKSLSALENAKEKASSKNKTDWQRVIDMIKERKADEDSTQDWSDGYKDEYQDDGTSDNKTGDGGTSNTTSPNQSQPSSSKWQRHR